MARAPAGTPPGHKRGQQQSHARDTAGTQTGTTSRAKALRDTAGMQDGTPTAHRKGGYTHTHTRHTRAARAPPPPQRMCSPSRTHKSRTSRATRTPPNTPSLNLRPVAQIRKPSGFGRILAEWSIPGQVWSKLPDAAPIQSKSGRIRASFGRVWADLSRVWSSLSPNRWKSTRILSIEGQHGRRSSHMSQLWTELPQIRPNSTGVGQIRCGIGRDQAIWPRMGPIWASIGLHSEKLHGPRSGTQTEHRVYCRMLSEIKPMPHTVVAENFAMAMLTRRIIEGPPKSPLPRRADDAANNTWGR